MSATLRGSNKSLDIAADPIMERTGIVNMNDGMYINSLGELILALKTIMQ
jgi:hypothetical protein